MRPLLLLAVTLLMGTACTAPLGGAPGQVQVVASAYPFAWLAQRVGGTDVHVTDLVKPGAEPHDVELSPRQVGLVEQAAVVVYLKGFQPAVDDALQKGSQGFNLGTVVSQRAKDPHIWLDPVLMVAAADGLAQRLVAKDPRHAAGYRARTAAVVADLGRLEATFTTALTGCVRKQIVTSHSAFGYLATRYGLVQKGISGLSPDAEPSPGRVAAIAEYAKKEGVTTIFFESLVDPKVAQTVASEIGAQTAVLDPVEGVKRGDNYLSVQRRNAQALHKALGCT